MMNICEALNNLTIDRLDAEVLLAHVLEVPRSSLHTWPEKTLTPDQHNKFHQFIQRRSQGEPLAYLLGEKEFWSLPFIVNNHVLTPRADTERVVEVLLQTPNKPLSVLELGTGSGAIAVSLAVERSLWEITATDKQAEALKVARQNADNHVPGRIQFLQSDWFEKVTGSFDIVVSNPPYIDSTDPHLNSDGVRFEPKVALVAQQEGLSDLRHIINEAFSYLKPNGLLVLEHGYTQANQVRALLEEKGYQSITSVIDLNGCDRVSFAYKP